MKWVLPCSSRCRIYAWLAQIACVSACRVYRVVFERFYGFPRRSYNLRNGRIRATVWARVRVPIALAPALCTGPMDAVGEVAHVVGGGGG